MKKNIKTSLIQITMVLAVSAGLAGCTGVEKLFQKPTPDLLPGSVLLSDDFSSTQNGWKTWDQDESRVSYQGGGLYFYIHQPHVDFWSKPGYKFSDVKIQADAIKLDGPDNNSYGVICRMVDEANFYAFVISSDGYAGILKVFEGNYQLINSDTMEFSAAIGQGNALNQMTAVCDGDQLSLAVNGQQVFQIQDAEFASGDIGFIAGAFDDAGVEILFDNLAVLQP